jgi:hypothetical protein
VPFVFAYLHSEGSSEDRTAGLLERPTFSFIRAEFIFKPSNIFRDHPF